MSIDQLHPSGLNPRKAFDEAELAELAEFDPQQGAAAADHRPPRPRRGGYEIVAGERRWRAAQKAALHTVPVIVRELVRPWRLPSSP